VSVCGGVMQWVSRRCWVHRRRRSWSGRRRHDPLVESFDQWSSPSSWTCPRDLVEPTRRLRCRCRELSSPASWRSTVDRRPLWPLLRRPPRHRSVMLAFRYVQGSIWRRV